MTDLTAAQLAVVTSGLPLDGVAPRVRGLTISARELDELVGWALGERLDGLLWNALHVGDLIVAPGDLEWDAGVIDRARDGHLAGLRSSLAAEATGAHAVAVLKAVGVEPFLFKGLANAHLDYPDPAQRSFFDADLLVQRTDLGPAIDALLDAGFVRARPPLRRRWEHRFARAVEMRSPAGTELDLHASLATGYFGEILDHDVLRADRARVDFGGIECNAFGSAGRLMISSYAIVLSRGPGLRLLRDLAQQLLVTRADWEHSARLAGHGAVVLAEGILRVSEQLRIDHESVDWATKVTAAPTARRALDYASDAEQQGWSADARSTLLALGPVDRLRFIAGVIAPSRAHLRSRRRSIGSHLTRRGVHPQGRTT
jgi:hypothetical protein